jgi:hypothetical protein
VVVVGARVDWVVDEDNGVDLVVVVEGDVVGWGVGEEQGPKRQY